MSPLQEPYTAPKNPGRGLPPQWRHARWEGRVRRLVRVKFLPPAFPRNSCSGNAPVTVFYRKLTLMNASVVVEQNPEAYIHSYITYPDKRRMNWYYTEMLIYVPWCLACPFAPSLPPDPPPVESTMEFKTTLPSPLPVLVFVVLLLVFGGIRVPGEPLFVERDDHLRTLDVGLLCRHQVGFIWIFPAQGQKKLKFRQFPHKRQTFWLCCVNKPFHEEHEFSRGICGTDDPLWNQPPSKPPQLLWLRVRQHQNMHILFSFVQPGSIKSANRLWLHSKLYNNCRIPNVLYGQKETCL